MIKHILNYKSLIYLIIFILFFLGVYFRVATFNNYGFYFDTVYTMYNWAKIVDENGYFSFWQNFDVLSKNYEIDYFDYLPFSIGYIYLIYILSKATSFIFNLESQLSFVFTLKFLNFICDLILIYIIYELLKNIGIKSHIFRLLISVLIFSLPSIWSISVMWGQLDVFVVLLVLVLLNRLLGKRKITYFESFLWGIFFAILLNFKVHVLIYLPIILYLFVNNEFGFHIWKKYVFIWILLIANVVLIIGVNILNLQSLIFILYLLAFILIIYLARFNDRFVRFSSGMFLGIISILSVFFNVNFTLYTNNILGFMTKEDVVSMYAANLWLVFGFLSETPTVDAFVFGINVKYLFCIVNLLFILLLFYLSYKIIKLQGKNSRNVLVFIYFIYLIFFIYTSTKMHSRYLIYAILPATVFLFILYHKKMDKSLFVVFVIITSILVLLHLLFFLNQVYVFFDNYSYDNTKFIESINFFSLEQISIFLLFTIISLIYFSLNFIKNVYLIKQH